MYFHEIRPQTLPQTLSRFCLNQPILQRQKSAICPENGAVHPRKTRVPPPPPSVFPTICFAKLRALILVPRCIRK